MQSTMSTLLISYIQNELNLIKKCYCTLTISPGRKRIWRILPLKRLVISMVALSLCTSQRRWNSSTSSPCNGVNKGKVITKNIYSLTNKLSSLWISPLGRTNWEARTRRCLLRSEQGAHPRLLLSHLGLQPTLGSTTIATSSSQTAPTKTINSPNNYK